MKRVLVMLLALLLAVCCQPALAEEAALRGYSASDGYVYVALGQYPQEADGTVLPIVWRVLATEDDHAYLLSEYILQAHRLHDDYKAWEKSGGDFAITEMCAFLNGEFAQTAFTDAELTLLVETESYGRLFLVTKDDLKNASYGFTSDESRKAWGTAWATRPNAKGQSDLFIYRSARGNHSPYWTLTQSTTNPQAACCTKAKGNIGYINVITVDEGCRPACYLDLSLAVITGGSGTLDDPYTIGAKEAE